MSHHLHVPLVGAVMFFFAACSHMQEAPPIPPQPIVITKEVQVPVAVSCVQSVPDAPAPPAKPDIKSLTADFAGAWDGIAWLKGYLAILKQDNARLRGLLQACAGSKK